MLAELTNANIPFVSVLPSSADNHQLENATYYKRNLILFFRRKRFEKQTFTLIKEIYNNDLGI